MEIYSPHSIVVDWLGDALIFSGLRHIPDHIVRSAYGSSMSALLKGNEKEAKRTIYTHFLGYIRSREGRRWIYRNSRNWKALVSRPKGWKVCNGIETALIGTRPEE